MKHNYFLNIAKITLLCLFLAPAMSFAQAEFYGRPAYWRPYDQRGINIFETTKADDSISFSGPRVRLGAGFTQQYQNLKQSASNNKAATINKLYPLSSGFQTAMANLFLDIQLADGIHLNVTTYLSTRHHNEAWVKGGYIQFDKLPLNSAFLNKIMAFTTIKVGHMEVNYGDAHYRRSDAGQTMYNPFMESYIMDAFATEIGGEVIMQKNGLFGSASVTTGMIKGNIDSATVGMVGTDIVDNNLRRSPSFILKGGFDKKFSDQFRVRFSGSLYHNNNNGNNGLTLYGGDRGGSNYQNVIEKWKDATGAIQASTAIAFSGRFNPGFTKKIDAVMLNGFVKMKGLELFGTYEYTKGRSKVETTERTANQLAGDILYRFGKEERFYVGARYNTVNASLPGVSTDITINRTALAGGWFMTKNILMKAEYVDQHYNDYSVLDYHNAARFHGYVIEAVVGF